MGLGIPEQSWPINCQRFKGMRPVGGRIHSILGQVWPINCQCFKGMRPVDSPNRYHPRTLKAIQLASSLSKDCALLMVRIHDMDVEPECSSARPAEAIL